MKRSAGGPGATRLAIVALIVAVPGASRAETPRLRPGAVEIGLAGSLVSTEGTTTASVALRGTRFARAGPGLAGIEAELGYLHLQALDMVELEGGVSWQRAAGAGAAHPFASVGGGLRQERLGSFRTARYPVGFALGARALFGDRAGLRAEYRFRRVLNDPVADFNEHQARLGISLMLNNGARPDEASGH
ncbi:MAG: hypothetical protein ACRENJ_01390 [Candidatus Eiseniibacteriota bacterium]